MSGITISAVLSSHLGSTEEKMETGILDRDWGFADIRENLTVASQNQRRKISQICVLKFRNEEKEQQGTRCDDKCLIIFELDLAAWVGFDAIKLKYRPDEWD